MDRVLNWAAWIVAVLLAVVMFLSQNSSAILHNNELTVSGVLISALVALGCQIGLFLSPWAVNWTVRYKKLVSLTMLPSILWLLSSILAGHSDGNGDHASDFADLLIHGSETALMVFCLIISSVQAGRVMAGFLFRPADGSMNDAEKAKS